MTKMTGRMKPNPQLISLTRWRFALVDRADYPFLSKLKWCAQFYPKLGKWYAMRTAKIGGIKRSIAMHRMILGFPSKEVDHVNGNSLDNRRVNLRIAGRSGNMRNRSRNHCKPIPFKGVFRSGKSFKAAIKNGRENYYLGSFKKAKDAALAYDKAARKLFDRFARTNFEL